VSSTLRTPQEVAGTLRVSVNTVHRLAERGEIASIRVGRLRRFTEEAVQAYLDRATERPPTRPSLRTTA
jgi:excisionase family DNA binding protein